MIQTVTPWRIARLFVLAARDAGEWRRLVGIGEVEAAILLVASTALSLDVIVRRVLFDPDLEDR